METALIAKVKLQISAPVEKVWKALIDPEQIKEYFFGTQAISDWKKGSTLIFKGEWEGKEYEDKGVIKDIIPNKLLHYTYWSNLSGTENKPENYANIIYEVKPLENGTELTITQDNIASDEKKEKSENDWNWIMGSLKKMVEND